MSSHPFILGFRRALPTVINIDHQTCRIQHKSQDLACKRCRYMGHQDQETEKCNAYINNQNMIAIHQTMLSVTIFYVM